MYDLERLLNMNKITQLNISHDEMTYEKIAKCYILNTFTIDISNIKTKDEFDHFINSTEEFKIYSECESIDEFYAIFCFKEFNLYHEPSKKFQLIKDKINSAIRYVEGIIDEYSAKLISLDGVNLYASNMPIENVYNNRDLLATFIEKNKILLENQKNFLNSEIVNGCIWESMGGIDSIRLNALTSQYAWKITSDVVLMHKYGDFLASTNEYQNIRQAYEDNMEGKENDYINKMEKYIIDRDVLNAIASYAENNHILHEQRDIIIDAIDLYRNKKYASFSWIVISILEYILNQLCLINNATIDDLTSKGMKMKFEKFFNLTKNTDSRVYFSEYFYDILPFIRNKISHGWYSSKDSYIFILSSHLLLDLRSLCKALLECKCKLNNDIVYLSQICKEEEIHLNRSNLIHYLHIVSDGATDNKLDVFYKLDKAYEISLAYFLGEEFLNSIKSILQELSEGELREVIRTIHSLEKLRTQECVNDSAKRIKSGLVSFLREKKEKRKKLDEFLKKMKGELSK